MDENENSIYTYESDCWFGEKTYKQNNGTSAMISTKDWVKVLCLSFLDLIPFVGPVVYLIVNIVLAFKNGVAKSIQNYFKVMLIFNLISTIAIASIVVPFLVAGFLIS